MKSPSSGKGLGSSGLPKEFSRKVKPDAKDKKKASGAAALQPKQFEVDIPVTTATFGAASLEEEARKKRINDLGAKTDKPTSRKHQVEQYKPNIQELKAYSGGYKIPVGLIEKKSAMRKTEEPEEDYRQTKTKMEVLSDLGVDLNSKKGPESITPVTNKVELIGELIKKVEEDRKRNQLERDKLLRVCTSQPLFTV
jgi:hypothetical protein